MKVLLSWRRPKAAFRYPGAPVPRTAVLEPWFARGGADPQIRIFATQPDELERFAPQAIAASWQHMEELARSAGHRPDIARETAPKIAPTHAVIVLHRSDRVGAIQFVPLGVEAREQLWQAFHVPIYEQVIGPRGVLLATECAAHHGLHIETPGLQVSNAVDASPCGCGRSTPRLVPSGAVKPLQDLAALSP